MSKFSLNKIGVTLTNKMGKTGLKLRKASPDILVVAGIAGVIGATVMACKATRKVDDVLEKHNEELENIKAEKAAEEAKENAEDSKKDDNAETPSDAPERSYRASITKTYIHTAVELGRLYGPSAVLYGVSIACIFKSHGMLKNRNIALAAAYETLDNAFKRYRGNVVEKYGEEEDYVLKTGCKPFEQKEVEIDPETGEETGTVFYTRPMVDIPPQGSEYGRWFCKQTSTLFEGSPVHDLARLRGLEGVFTQLLTSRGHVFLNEVYSALGFDHTPAGAVVGWIMGAGDNCVDFGLGEDELYTLGHKFGTIVDPLDMSALREGFWLDFNVDGVIYDKI